MKRRTQIVLLSCCIACAFAGILTRPGISAKGPVYHSPLALALSPDGKALYAVDHTAQCVALIDTAKGSVTGSIAVDDPNGAVLSPDGKTLYVSSGKADRVCKIDTASRRIIGEVGVGRQPMGLALSSDGKTLYCCNKFTNDVSVIDTVKMAKTGRIRAIREPRFVAVVPGGKTLVVINELPLGSDLDDRLGANVTLVDLASGSTTDVQLSLGATDASGVCCSPDGHFAYVVHVLARWLVPPTQIERGWISTNALTIIDLQAKKRVNTVLLDDLDRGAANPWDIAISKSGDTLYVTHAGVNEVQIIDTAKLHKLVNEWPADSPTELQDDLTALYRAGVRTRMPSGGTGARGVLASDAGVFVANYFSGTVTKLEPGTGKLVQTISLGQQPQADKARHGEMLFHDASVCFQGWQSCSSCHPDARVDGLAWDLLNDGPGNPRHARSMLLSGQTPPVMSRGVRESMKVAVDAGYKFILFHVPTQEENDDTAAYIDSLTPARSPHRNPDGSFSAAALRGKAIFEREDVGCAKCHPGPLFTDRKPWDVGTKPSTDTKPNFYTPTLVECFRTAPYLHDGSVVTIREVVRDHNKNDQHGKTSQLSEKELHDLVEYVLSL
jgi:YVTN family beta-propeller protein